MSTRNITSPDRTILKSPKPSSNSRTLRSPELTTYLTEEEEKTQHVAEINAKYHKRLIKPLQVNQRIRFQNEFGSFEMNRQFQQHKLYTPFNEDKEKKYLIDKVKELTKISALHDREVGIEKPSNHLRKLKKPQNILQQHLESGLYNYIKEVNEKFEKSKKGPKDTKARSSDAPKDLNRLSISSKSPKEIIQKQLEAMKEVKDKNVVPKQLNANNFFRHSQRKLLYLRTMEAMESVVSADQLAESFFRKEAEKEKEKKQLMRLALHKSQSSISQKSMKSLYNQEKSMKSSSPLHKMTQSALLLRETQSLGSPLSQQNINLHYKSYDLIGLTREPKEVAKETEHSNLFSLGFPSPIEPRENFILKSPSQPYNMNLFTDADTPKPKTTVSMIRTSSQPIGRGRKKTMSESYVSEKEEGETSPNLTYKLNYIDTQRSIIDIVDEEESPDEEKKIIKEVPQPEGQKDEGQVFYKRLSGIKSKDKLYVPPHRRKPDPIQTYGVEENKNPVEMENKRVKDNLRANLLNNIKKAKEFPNLTFDNIQNETSSYNKKWPTLEGGTFPVNRIRATRLKSPEIGVKRKKARKNKQNSHGNWHKNNLITELDREAFIRGLSEEKIPLKEEMQGILTK